MATRRRTTSRTTRRTRRRRTGPTFHMPVFDDEIIRTLVAITLLIVGVVTLIGLALPEPGQADRLVARLDRAMVRQPAAPLPDHPAGLRRLARVAAAEDRVAAAGGRDVRGVRLPDGHRRVSSRTRGSSRARAAAGSGCSWPTPCPSLITVPGTFVVLLLVGVAALGARARPAAAGAVRGPALGRQGGRCRAAGRPAG